MIDINRIKPKVALVAANGLGDGLLFMIVAFNLHNNGYAVEFYSDFVSQLEDWQPHFPVYPFPTQDKIKSTFEKYDLVIADAISVITTNNPVVKYKELAKHYVFVCMAPFAKELAYDRTKILQATIKDKTKLAKLLLLAAATGTLIHKSDNHLPMTGRIKKFCEKKLQLKNVVIDNGLTVPKNLVHRKHGKRVIIHPASATATKNWHLKKYIKLAKKLAKKAWQPVFIMSSKERLELEAKIPAQFLGPVFSNIQKLAEFIYESGYMIGNDSGIGHLASNLQLPVLIITGSRKPHYAWRPGWSKCILVNAPHNPKWWGKKFWQYLISVRRVFREFMGLIEAAY